MKIINILDSVDIDGSIIDIESTHFDPEQGELITVGFLSNDGFTIIQRAESSEPDFKAFVKKRIDRLAKKPTYAFKKQCEEGFCERGIDNDLQRGIESTYIALKNEGLLNLYNFLCDPLFNEEIPLFWETWKTTHKPLFLSKIARHNYCCLAKEYYLKLKRYDGLRNEEIARLAFISSAAIEKMHIRKALNFELD